MQTPTYTNVHQFVARNQLCLYLASFSFSPSSYGGKTAHCPDYVELRRQSKRKKTWSRAVFSNLQRKGLEKRFEVQKYVTKPDRRQLAAMLGLTDAQVHINLD